MKYLNRAGSKFPPHGKDGTMTRKQIRKLDNRVKAFAMILKEKTCIANQYRWLDKTRAEIEKATLTNEEKQYLLVHILKEYNDLRM